MARGLQVSLSATLNTITIKFRFIQMRKLVLSLLLLLLLPAAAFAADGEQGREASYYLWRLINEARMAPLKALEKAGISETSAREALGEREWVLDQGLPPVAWNDLLFTAASGHAGDMVTRVYYSTVSPEGAGPAERIAAAGEEVLKTGESLGILAFNNYMPPLEAARAMFHRMLAHELDPAIPVPMAILHPDMTQAGIAFKAASLDLGLDMPVNLYVAVADVALPVNDQPFLVGNICRRADPAGTWRPENGLPGMTVVLVGSEPGLSAVSQELGAYQIPIRNAFFVLEARDPRGDIAGRWFAFGEGKNRLRDLIVDP
jgi:hypothetical protein